MNKRTIITSLAIFGILAGGAGFAQAYNGHGMGYGMGDGQGMGYGYHHERGHFADCPYADGSGRGYYGYAKQGKQLTDEQIAQFDKVRSSHFEKMQPLWDQLHSKRMELNALKYNPNTEPETLTKLVKDITDIENKIDTERKSFRAQLEKDFGIEYYGGYGRHHRMGKRACY